MFVRSPHKRTRVWTLWALGLAGFVALLCAVTIQQGQGQASPISRDDVQSCLACHSSADTSNNHVVNTKGLSISPHKDLKCQDCHTAVTGAPHTPAMLSSRVDCGMCHSQEMDDYHRSVHSRPDKVAGDHPTCISCHAKGNDPHAIRYAKFTGVGKVMLCSRCHAQTERMERYKVDPDAVPSYNESFHGKALLNFGFKKAANCVNCHSNHAVLSPNDPGAPTNPNHVAQTCGQPGCHRGAKLNFAMSGANHLALKMKTTPILKIEAFFFRWLTVLTVVFLLGGVALDLRTRVFSRGPEPAAGRATSLIISVSFLFLVAALLIAVLGVSAYAAVYTAIAAVLLMIIAFLVYFASPKQPRTKPGEKRFLRFTVAQRVQHACLFTSFTLLAITGMPLRFADVHAIRDIDFIFGGLQNARLIHRGAAILMISTWIWHTIYLFYRWAKAGFSFKSWTMFPTLKDVKDFIDVSAHYLGFAGAPPKYDRFQFREKFDYFAVYWGMPIMVFSGLVLWFPVFIGNRLPQLGLGIAYIAHSDEALLALLAIVTWHFYNAHFNPEHFPMSNVFYSGAMTESQMEEEHPLELERIEKGEGNTPAAEVQLPPEPGNGSTATTD